VGQEGVEGGAFLRYVIDNWAEVAAEWVPKIRAKIEERFDLGSIAVAMYELLQDVRMIDLVNQRCGPGMGELIDEVWDDLPPVFGVQDIADAVRARSKTMDLDRELESHSTSRWLFVDQLLLRHPGWRDRGTLVPTWSKED